MKGNKRPFDPEISDDAFLNTEELIMDGGTAGSRGVSSQGGGDGGTSQPRDPGVTPTG